MSAFEPIHETVSDLTPIPALEARLSEELAKRSTVFLNLGQRIVAVPEDRLRLNLRDYQETLRARGSWHTPAGILIGLIPTLIATEFKDFLLNAATWKAAFLLLGIGCTFWLVRDLIEAFRSRKRCDDLEMILDQLRKRG